MRRQTVLMIVRNDVHICEGSEWTAPQALAETPAPAEDRLSIDLFG